MSERLAVSPHVASIEVRTARRSGKRAVSFDFAIAGRDFSKVSDYSAGRNSQVNRRHVAGGFERDGAIGARRLAASWTHS